MNTKEKMLQARQLIQEKRYSEAQKLLKTIDHPTAQEWLAKLDKLVKPETKTLGKSVGANRSLIVGIGVFALVLVIGVLAVVAFKPKTDNLSVLPTEASVATSILPRDFIEAACNRANEQVLPSNRTNENFEQCIAVVTEGYNGIADEIRIYKPDAPNEDISYAMISCLNFAGTMLWGWTDQMLIMCSDLYLTYQAGAFELIRTADNGCFEQEIRLGSSSDDELHDGCIRRNISTVTEIDYYHEDDSNYTQVNPTSVPTLEQEQSSTRNNSSGGRQSGIVHSTTEPTQVSEDVEEDTTANIPQTVDEFEQYVLDNYSSIAGQSLVIKRVDIESEPFRSVTVVLDYESGSWEIFEAQTRESAMNYAQHLAQDVEVFFGTDEDIAFIVSYSYYTDELQDYHHDDEWWYIGNFDTDRGWYVAKNPVFAYFSNNTWDFNIWNYK